MSYEEKPARGIPAAGVIAVGAALCLAAIAAGGARVTSALYWMILGVPLVLITAAFFVVRAVKPQALRRRWGTDPIERGFEVPLLLLAAVLAVATCAVSAVDYFHLRIGYMGGWWPPVGIVITSLGVMMYQQTLLAYGPHDRSRYGELPGPNASQGAYASVRHPLSGLFLLALLGIPLMMSSWIGLIGWALTAVVMMIYVSKEDRWRFVNYEWYYEYTTQARRRMIPMVW